MMFCTKPVLSFKDLPPIKQKFTETIRLAFSGAKLIVIRTSFTAVAGEEAIDGNLLLESYKKARQAWGQENVARPDGPKSGVKISVSLPPAQYPA